MSSTARSDLVVDSGWPWPLVLTVNRRARKLRLRLDPRRKQLVLTCPPRVGRRSALAWAEQHRLWAKQAVANIPDGTPLAPGAIIPFDGRDIRLEWGVDYTRTPRLVGETLRCGGPPEGFAGRIARWLRREALLVLSEETAAAAAKAGVRVVSVGVGDAATRWGSCSAGGAIRYNWRLILAPPAVRRWVVAHEVAHRLHLDHSPAFKQAEQALYAGDVAAARSELRRLSARLKGIGAPV